MIFFLQKLLSGCWVKGAAGQSTSPHWGQPCCIVAHRMCKTSHYTLSVISLLEVERRRHFPKSHRVPLCFASWRVHCKNTKTASRTDELGAFINNKHKLCARCEHAHAAAWRRFHSSRAFEVNSHLHNGWVHNLLCFPLFGTDRQTDRRHPVTLWIQTSTGFIKKDLEMIELVKRSFKSRFTHHAFSEYPTAWTCDRWHSSHYDSQQLLGSITWLFHTIPWFVFHWEATLCCIDEKSWDTWYIFVFVLCKQWDVIMSSLCWNTYLMTKLYLMKVLWNKHFKGKWFTAFILFNLHISLLQEKGLNDDFLI